LEAKEEMNDKILISKTPKEPEKPINARVRDHSPLSDRFEFYNGGVLARRRLA